MNSTEEIKKDPYKTSRVLYIIEALVEYLTALLVSGAFIAKLTSVIGISDSLTGIISAFTSLGCGFQMLSIFISRKNGVKKQVIFMALISEVLFTFVYVIPLVEIPSYAKTVLFVVCTLLANVLLQVGNSPKLNWFMSLVDDNKRGIFTSVKQIISLIGGMIFQTVMGSIIDRYEEKGEIRTGFIISAITLAVIMVVHMLTMIFSKEKPMEEEASSPVRDRMKKLLSNKGFLRVVLICVLWGISQSCVTPFLGTYQLNELGFSLTLVPIIQIVYSVVRMAFEAVWGNYSDRHSFAATFRICAVIEAAAMLMIVLSPANGLIFFILYEALFGISIAGVNSALMNLVFDYVPRASRSDALALKSTIYGFAGFFTTLAASPLVTYVQKRDNCFFGVTVYAQQILAGISVIVLLLLSVFVGKVMLKKGKR